MYLNFKDSNGREGRKGRREDRAKQTIIDKYRQTRRCIYERKRARERQKREGQNGRREEGRKRDWLAG